MKLWLRYRQASSLFYDREIDVSTQQQWAEAIAEQNVISSILWSAPPVFVPQGPHYRGRRHPHERGYVNDRARNADYRRSARQLAARLAPRLRNRKCLVYAPLRGALPIWNAIQRFLPDYHPDVYLPVTSSFVFYPPKMGIRNTKGNPGSGHTTHRLELKRLEPLLSDYDELLYVDEIISGGSLAAHLRAMFELGLDRKVRIAAAGLADRFGARSERNRALFESWVREGRLSSFLFEGCKELITEDNRLLLGLHYTDYRLGPNCVPVLTDAGDVPTERLEFEQEDA